MLQHAGELGKKIGKAILAQLVGQGLLEDAAWLVWALGEFKKVV